MGKSKSWFDFNHDWITHNDLIWRIMIWFGKLVILFGFDLKFCDLIWNLCKSQFFPIIQCYCKWSTSDDDMLSLLCTESIVHLQQYLDLPITNWYNCVLIEHNNIRFCMAMFWVWPHSSRHSKCMLFILHCTYTPASHQGRTAAGQQWRENHQRMIFCCWVLPQISALRLWTEEEHWWIEVDGSSSYKMELGTADDAPLGGRKCVSRSEPHPGQSQKRRLRERSTIVCYKTRCHCLKCLKSHK